jgi:hypothetical protein
MLTNIKYLTQSNNYFPFTIFIVCIFLNLSTFISSVQCQEKVTNENDTRAILAPDCSYELTAPKGWQWDDEAFVQNHDRVLFIKKHGDRKSKILFMKTNVVKRENNNLSLDEYIIIFNKRMSNDDSSFESKKIESIIINKKDQIPVYSYTSKLKRTFWSIAYIECDHNILQIILSSTDKNKYVSSFKAFKELVCSYGKITEYIEME